MVLVVACYGTRVGEQDRRGAMHMAMPSVVAPRYLVFLDVNRHKTSLIIVRMSMPSAATVSR